MEEILPPLSFARVHKSYIVSMQAITAIHGNTIELEDVQLPIGSNYKEEFIKRIER
ncbi:LytTR family DNA-binding domain-containing protein [[Flexibacter] sp. ATCC 35208]|uniref:LytTR family DNA-binding domain-containing protein n=1 Tax=[Flexibacter] sp. ATCC 35208 TaxID=1936242 RepID=UPI0015C34C55|nr:LytTR family DNA-binding domain-containing protein [[Flexibacter] sp. ATCC 35208]